MNKLSVFQTVLMVVFGLAALIGLFVFATYTGSNDSANSIGTVTIWGTLPRDTVENALNGLKQIDQSLKDVNYMEKDAATLSSDLASAIATGSSPDLILASEEELLALSKYISPIPPSSLSIRTFQSTFVDGAGILAAPGGGYWGMPFLIDPLVLFNNRDILASNGIAKPPATWEAITGLVPGVAELSPSRQVTRGLIALGTYNNVHNARSILSTLFLQTSVPITGYSSNGFLSADLGGGTNNGVPPGEAVLRFYTQFADPSKVSYTWNAALPDSQKMFQTGDLALYLGFASEARYFKAANPNLNFDASAAPQPSTANTKTVYGRVYSFMIPRGAPNAAGAYQAEIILSGADAQTIAAAITGLAPTSLTALSNPSPDPILSVAYAEALYAKNWLSPLPTLTDPVFSSMINNVISGRTTLQTALSLAERSLSALMQ